MFHFYNKNRKNLTIFCPILNLQGCKTPALDEKTKYTYSLLVY